MPNKDIKFTEMKHPVELAPKEYRLKLAEGTNSSLL